MKSYRYTLRSAYIRLVLASFIAAFAISCLVSTTQESPEATEPTAARVDNSNNVEAERLHQAAIILSSQGRLDEAIDQWSRAIIVSPGFAKAYYNRGVDQFTLGRYQRAIFDFGQAIKLGPDLLEAHSFRGRSYMRLDDPKNAIREYSQALEKGEQFVFYGLRSQAYARMGRFSEATQDLERAVQLGGDRHYLEWSLEKERERRTADITPKPRLPTFLVEPRVGYAPLKRDQSTLFI